MEFGEPSVNSEKALGDDQMPSVIIEKELCGAEKSMLTVIWM